MHIVKWNVKSGEFKVLNPLNLDIYKSLSIKVYIIQIMHLKVHTI